MFKDKENYGELSPDFQKELEHLAEMKKDNFISDREIANFAMDLWSMKPAELWENILGGYSESYLRLVYITKKVKG